MFIFTLIFGGLFGVGFLFYLYTKFVTYKTWSRKDVLVDEPIFPIGNTKTMILGQEYVGVRFANLYKKAREQKLKHVGFYLLNFPAYIPADLAVLKQIMVKDFNVFPDRGFYVNEERDPISGHLFFLEGQKWRNLRAKLTPTFTSGKMKIMFNIVRDISFEMVRIVGKLNKTNEPIDSKDVFSRYTVDVIGNIAFGIDCNSLKNDKPKFQLMGQRVFQPTIYEWTRDIVSFTYSSFFKYFGISAMNEDISTFFLNLTNEIVTDREKTGKTRNDFMQLLINLKHNKVMNDENSNEENMKPETSNSTSLNLTNDEIAAQAFVFFVAGFETSSSTINYCIYELCKHPEIQEKLRQEINGFIKESNGEITYEAIMKAPYLDKVINETLRKYPVLSFVPRVCVQDYKILDSDIVLKKGTKLCISILGIHHDPEYYPEPEKFDPERFSEESKQKRPPLSFLPFGEGPRVCIGMRFGLMQTKIGVAQMVKHFRMKLNPKTIEPVEYLPRSFVLTAKNPFWVDFEKI